MDNKFKYYHNDLINNKTFDEIETILKDRNFLEIFSFFLKKIGFDNFNIRNYSIIYIINSYPEEVVGDINIDSNKKLLDDSKLIINQINEYFNDNSKSLLIKNTFNYFSINFNKWLKKDSMLMVKELTQIFWELENNINEINKNDELKDKNIIIDSFKNKQKDIINKIKKFGGKDGIKYLENSNPVIINDKLYNQIEENFKKAFWNKFENDINEFGFITVIPILKEIKEYLINLNSSKKIIDDINEKIDLELIEQMIKNDSFTIDSIRSLGVFIIDKVKYIGSISDDKEMDNWKIELYNKNITNLGLFLKDFFSEILNKIFSIMKEIKNIVNDPNYQKLKEL